MSGTQNVSGHTSFNPPSKCPYSTERSDWEVGNTCERCKAFYIGKTEQQLAARISEHSGISARTGKKLQTKPRSDIYDHCQNCHVHVQPENFSIIDTLPTEKGLLILESLHQKIKKPQIGVQQKSTPLMSFD